MIKVLPPKTVEEVVAREKERKARTTLLMALPKDHLAKFYKIADAKEMWKAIKFRFGGNNESKKMQKYLLKQQFEGFSVSSSEDLKFPNKVYKVVKDLYGLHQALRACVKTASTPIETQKPLVKDEEAVDVDVHLYRSMIGSLMYLTASRPDIMFVVCACSRFQFSMSNPHQELASPEANGFCNELTSPKQTAIGKDK
nr:xylulose kinase-1 [Tanacetum cinerariifolium]